MHDYLGHHASQKELEEAQCELKIGPIMSVFQNLKAIAFEINFAIEIKLMERLHGNFILASVLLFVCGIKEVQIMLNGQTRKLRLLILAWREGRKYRPEPHQNRDASKESKKHPCLEAAAELGGDVVRDHNDERTK